jgi:type IV secretory pathway TraG/TraD family ATPase VirD4
VTELPEELRPEALAAANQIELYYSQEPDNIATVDNLITQAYGDFLRARTRRYSPAIPKDATRTTFYDRIIDDGILVLVSVSPSQPGLAKVLSTLIKNLFMQSVRGRLDRVRSGRLRNFERPIVLACDEYSQVASEIAGQVGDGDFFSVARQQGCMGLLATQSVNVLQASALKENWKSIFSNFGAKIFMRAVDNETVEEATKLAGETDWYETSLGTSSGGQGSGSSTQTSLKERKALPGHILTQLIETGQGVVIGTLDGRTKPALSFFHVPSD